MASPQIKRVREDNMPSPADWQGDTIIQGDPERVLHEVVTESTEEEPYEAISEQSVSFQEETDRHEEPYEDNPMRSQWV